MQNVSQWQETIEHLLCECEPLTISRGRIFRKKIWRALTTLTCPSESISTVCQRDSWEIIVGEAQQILKCRSALGSNDHPIKPMPIPSNK